MNGSNDVPSIFDSIFGKGKPIKWYHYLIHLGYYNHNSNLSYQTLHFFPIIFLIPGIRNNKIKKVF